MTPVVIDELITLVGRIAVTVGQPPAGGDQLIPLAAACEVCRGGCGLGYATCPACQKHRQSPDGTALADRVAPIAYAVTGSPTISQQMYTDAYQYKESTTSPSLTRMVALVTVFTELHLPCLERAGGPIAHLIPVPSSRGRTNHPLARVLAPLLGRPITPAQFTGTVGPRGKRRIRPQDFALPPVSGHVLVLEDTWTTGSHSQSVAVAARAAGATQVSIVPVLRILDCREWPPARDLVDSWGPTARAWDPYRCTLTGTRHT